MTFYGERERCPVCGSYLHTSALQCPWSGLEPVAPTTKPRRYELGV